MTSAAGGKRGCGHGVNHASGCRYGVQSRPNPGASRRGRCCRAYSRAADREKGIQAQFAAVGAFLFPEGKDRAQESYARQQTPTPGQAAPAMDAAAPPTASPDHRGGPARGRAARRAPAPAFRAAHRRPPRRRHRLDLGAVPGGGCPARSGGGDPPRQRSGGLTHRVGPEPHRTPPHTGIAVGADKADLHPSCRAGDRRR